MSKKTPPPKAGHTVPVLRKAIKVFEAVARNSGGITAKELAVSLQIAPSTCYRILQSFVAEGWLRPRNGGTFELSFGLIPLLKPLFQGEVLVQAVREPMAQLAIKTGLTAKLTVRQGDDAITIFSAQSPRPHAIASRVGAVVSLAIGSSGAAFLGALTDEQIGRILDAAPADAWRFQERQDVYARVKEVRKQGCCFDKGSYQVQIRTLSAPLHASNHEVVGVITLLGFAQDFDGPGREGLVRELKYAAGGCSQLIKGVTT